MLSHYSRNEETPSPNQRYDIPYDCSGPMRSVDRVIGQYADYTLFFEQSVTPVSLYIICKYRIHKLHVPQNCVNTEVAVGHNAR